MHKKLIDWFIEKERITKEKGDVLYRSRALKF